MIRKVTYLLCFVLISQIGLSQQLPHYSLYMYNDAVLNPAVCGTKSYNFLTLISRNQWAGFEGAPKTQLLTYQRSQTEKMGLGGTIFNDATGPISRTGAQLSYAYRIPVVKDYKLSFGLSGSIYQYIFDNDKIILHDDIIDPSMPGGVEKTLVYDATFGTYFYNDKYYIGVSIPNLIQSKINLETVEDDVNKMVRHYFITSGYNYVINDDFAIEPSILLKGTGSSPLQLDINLRTIFRDYLWAGTSYRNKDALVLMFGVDYNNYSFGYSFDKTLSDISTYETGSHGIMLGYKFGKQKDSDRDGIPDDKDHCPNEYGSKENFGCPDSDNDGILDKNDNCPNEFGLIENAGCPDYDKDSVIDKEDNCPKTPGPVENQGCPIITKKQKAIIDTAFANLEFVFAKAEITFNSYSHLERLGKMLNNYPEMRLRITGHTDNVGGDEANMKLSEARANAVKTFLTSRGIEASIIFTLFYGETKPIATNETEEGRAKNRRVELTIFFE